MKNAESDTNPGLPSENVPLQFIGNDAFKSGDPDEFLFLTSGLSIYADRSQSQQIDVDGCGDFDQLRDLPLLSGDGEVFLFRKMNFLKYRAEQARQQYLDTGLPCHRNEFLALCGDADVVRNHIAECNVRLVISIARRFSNSAADFDELMSEGSEIMLKAISKFDVSRGFRFSTYATHSVQRHFYRYTQRLTKRNAVEFRSACELLNEVPSAEADPEISEWIQEEQRVTALIARMAERLDEREQMVVAARFGLGTNGVVKTLRELAADLDLSKERVRQLQIAAVEKLRDFFDELDPELTPV